MAGVGNNPSSWSLNNSAFTGWSFTDAVMYRAQLVWDTNSLAWVKSTGGTGPGTNVAVSNFPAVQPVSEGLSIPAYDYSSLAQASTTDTWSYKTGGSGGTLVSTVTITYTDATKATISTIVRT